MIEVEVKLALTDSKRVEQKLRKDGFRTAKDCTGNRYLF